MSRKNFKSVDILKGLAMVMVILVHYNQSFQNNISFFRFFQMGCQVFFVLSGFSIAMSFSKRLSGKKYVMASKSFYLSRFSSIAPPYYVMIVVVYLVNTLAIYLTGKTLSFGSNRNPIAILCNVLLIHGLVPSANNTVMPGGWYIGTTVLLYLVTPLLYFFFEKWKKNKKMFCILSSVLSISLIFVISFLIPESELLLLKNNSFGYFSILSQFPCFCMGMLLYFEYIETRTSNRKAIVYLIIGFLIMIGSMILFFNSSRYAYIFDVSLVGLATYYILKSMITYEASHDYAKMFAPLIEIGKKSFYVYLVHVFFAYTFISAAKKVLTIIGIVSESYLWFLIFMPIVIFLSYFSGCLLSWFINIFKSKFFNLKWASILENYD